MFLLQKYAASSSKTFRVGLFCFLVGVVSGQYFLILPALLLFSIFGSALWHVRHTPTLKRLILVVIFCFLLGVIRVHNDPLTIPVPESVFFTARSHATTAIRSVMPRPESILLLGMTIGEISDAPYWLTKRFRVTGTSHLVAVSGYNVTVAVTTLASLFFAMRLSRKIVAWLAVVVMVLFACLTGADPPVVRAAVMGTLVMFAREIGRTPDKTNLILAAAFGMTFVDPEIIRSVSFQLSIAATAGLLWLSPVINNQMNYIRIVRYIPELIRSAIAETTSATFATIPIALGVFGTFSTVTIFANVLFAPLVPFITIGGGALTLVTFILPDLGSLLALPFTFLIRGLLVVLGFFERIPHALLSGGAFPWWLSIFWYGCLFFIVRKGQLSQNFNTHKSI